MKKRKNRRTLKKRIRRVMSLSAFITVVSLSGLIMSIVISASNELATYQANVVCEEFQNKIKSGEAEKALGITGIENLEPNNKQIDNWIDGVIKNSLLYEIDQFNASDNKIYVQIKVKDEIIYSNHDSDYDDWEKFYSDTISQKNIIDSKTKQEVGSITVKVNPLVLLPIVGIILVTVVAVSILVLIISKILSMFFIIPIIKPLNQLDKKVKALAEGDNETALNTQLVLKRPLREIESLADSTNLIMNKLHGYNEILEQQKEALENQYAELEVQNDELMQSKQHIENQQAQLIQSEKMASVGLLTAAITHEINTPIGAINSNVQISDMLLGELAKNQFVKADEELFTMLHQLKETNDVNLIACSRIVEIIRSLKSFSRLDQAEYQETDISDSIDNVLVLTNNLLKNRITVNKDFSDLSLVHCYPGQLNQVFMNIIVNASQAIEGEGEIFIRTYENEGYLFVSIRDTGVGIKAENMNKIFEPGFTTKGVGIGLGIGLYLSYNIVQKHNGEISVISEQGKGTEFTIKLPLNQRLKEHTIEKLGSVED